MTRTTNDVRDDFFDSDWQALRQSDLARDPVDAVESEPAHSAPSAPSSLPAQPPPPPPIEDLAYQGNQTWEIDRAQLLERSERRAWQVAVAAGLLALTGITAVFVQGPLRRIVEIPIVVDRVTGETTIQQRLDVETIPTMEALDKHNLAAFVRAREGYSWMFLQRDFDQVARMAAQPVFGDYARLFEGDAALQKKLGASEDWRIRIVGVRLSPTGRKGNRGDATVTYDKAVRQTDRNLAEVVTRHVASVVFQYQPQALSKEADRLENPFGFVVTAYRSDPEINTAASGAKP
ncbi:VirB8 family protein [Leptothrix cholodnii SP-6]|uniref:VirB8 family protein n=1 Tax=Leptothrix cholodnii (strain ATCC 51168 / LMG 8142 / SP-6) TaxID=395495 RepID=B1Y1V8_LEPCP|nr:type IV secretion system protein [Leptothrix cholodnii]ACB33138.1 VirB8 family protein [Leptothrix cholodnii SP-6]